MARSFPSHEAPSFESRILLVGTGRMGEEYAKVLVEQGVAPERVTVVGRDTGRTEAFAKRWGGFTARAGGLAADFPGHEAAIIAVPPADLPAAALAVMDMGVRHILLEKPGALTAAGMEALAREAEMRGVRLVLAYNRRFYPSVLGVRRAIREDGGVIAVSFDISELECRILEDPVTMAWGEAALARWGVINSGHVIDLFVHLAGFPVDWVHHRAGNLAWHPTGAVFWGAGTTERGAAFAYLSTWSAAGRWSVEVTTPRRKLILRPLEEASFQERGGFAVRPLPVTPEPEGVKPGFHNMVGAFLKGGDDAEALCGGGEAVRLLRLEEEIFGYLPG